jgi:hypothetical protein
MTAWIAFFAIMMASLMPTVSRAMAAAATKASSSQACPMHHHDMSPAAGHHDMSMAAAHHAPSPEHGALHLDHCPFCVTHAGSFGLPPFPAFAVPVHSGPEAHQAVRFQSRRVLVAWTTAQPRAPPFVS